MFFIRGIDNKTDVYVMCEEGEMNPMRGEKNVRENHFPDQKYFHFRTDKIANINKISDLETDLYIAGLRFNQSYKRSDDFMVERAQELETAKQDLHETVTGLYPDVEVVTSKDIKKEFELREFFRTKETVKGYYYKNEGELMVFVVKGNIERIDDAVYSRFENEFAEMQAMRKTYNRESLMEQVKEYVTEHNHSMIIAPHKRYVDMTMLQTKPLDLSVTGNREKKVREK